MTKDAVTDLTRGVYRRIYSGFITGQRINKLSLNAEAWFWRVMATADDFGNAPADPDLCRAATAGRRSVTSKQIAGWLKEMKTVGLITLYRAKGEWFLHIVGFEESQPAGKNGKRIMRYAVPDESGCIQVNPDESSASQASDNDTEDDNDSDTEKESRSATAVSIFDYWREQSGHAHAQFTDKRRSRVMARLKQGYSVEQLQSAIRGNLASPFHSGQNDSGQKFDDLELVCRDGEHVEQFIAISENGVSRNGKPTASERRIDQLRANAEFLRSGGGAANRQEPNSGGLATTR